jgi:hypothetical protein
MRPGGPKVNEFTPLEPPPTGLALADVQRLERILWPDLPAIKEEK